MIIARQLLGIFAAFLAFIAVGAAASNWMTTKTSFSSSDVTKIENEIKVELLKKMENSPSAVEADQIKSSSTTVAVTMSQIDARTLERFSKYTLRDQLSRTLGLGEITVPCHAKLTQDGGYLWRCGMSS